MIVTWLLASMVVVCASPPTFGGDVVRAGSISITPSSGVAGTRVVVSGRISPRMEHRVKLQRRDSSGWVTIKRTKTDVKGRYAFTTLLPGDRSNAVYRVLSPKRLDPRTGKSVQYVTPRRTVAIAAPPPVPTPPAVDQDGDGYPVTVDCNDADATVHPGAPDRPGDRIDQDCSGADAALGTGKVHATLRWDNVADLDLHMSEPDGTIIFWASPGPTSTGGSLDFDDNRGCGTPGVAAVENIHWPSDAAPTGRYTVWVRSDNPCSAASTSWHLTVKVSGVVVVDRHGEGAGAPIEFWVP